MTYSKVIGFCGGSASGKSRVVRSLYELYPDRITTVLQDAYYYAFDELTLEEKKKINYDHPDSFDITLMTEQLCLLKKGYSVECPIYSYDSYTRTGFTKVKPADIIVLDGIFLYHFPELRELIDIKFFIDASEQIRLQRMIERDIMERGRTKEFVIYQFFRDMKPMHDLMVEQQKEYADIVINGDQDFECVFNQVKKEFCKCIRR